MLVLIVVAIGHNMNINYYIITDMQIQCSSNEFIVGQYVRCSCTGYLDPISIEWYQGNTSLQQSFVNTSSIIIPVTTDSEGSVYTCLVTSFGGTHQEMFTLNTTGMS